nr:hypothetical protein Hi04_10k_c5981_00008 [uncultured bacterium]
MAKPLVTVVTPFYNAARFLPETIKSVCDQSFTDWEWLLVDDGSSDGSSKIAHELAAMDPRVRVLQHPGRVNRGPAASRNLAIRHAQGDFYAFIDADDVWIAEKLERDLAVFARHREARLTYSRMMHWFSWSGRVRDADRDELGEMGIPHDKFVEPPDLLIHFLSHIYRHDHQYPAPSCVMIRRDAQPEGEELFEDSAYYFEDAAFLTRLLLRYPAVVCEDIRTWHRRGGPSLTNRLKIIRPHAHLLFILGWIEKYVGAADVAHQRQVLDAVASVRRDIKVGRRLMWRRPILASMIWVGYALLPAATRRRMWNAFGSRLWFGKVS